jgi:osmotically-inducible protein OsmY
MKRRILITFTIALAAGLAGCDKRDSTTTRPAKAAEETKPATPATAPDNTATNRKDAPKDAKTPLDQSESASSIRITADIRRAVMEDTKMSVNAQNCKIITDEAGAVTLRGVVNSQQERDAIEAKAKATAGVTRIDNQLEIKAP